MATVNAIAWADEYSRNKMTANKTVAVSSQVLRTKRTTFKYRAWSKKTFLRILPPRLLSSSSITTREIEARADSVPAKKPAKAKSRTIGIMGRGFIYFLGSIASLVILAGQTLSSLQPHRHGHNPRYEAGRA